MFFGDLGLLGRLLDDALSKEIDGQKGKIKVFDLFAKIGEHGHRSLTCSNMPDGVYLKIVKKNGDNHTQAASLSSFQTRVMGQAVTAYIQQLDLIDLLSTTPETGDDGHEENFPG